MYLKINGNKLSAQTLTLLCHRLFLVSDNDKINCFLLFLHLSLCPLLIHIYVCLFLLVCLRKIVTVLNRHHQTTNSIICAILPCFQNYVHSIPFFSPLFNLPPFSNHLHLFSITSSFLSFLK